MGCLFVIFAGAFPRLANLFLWLARPTQFMAPFGGNFLWPILGIMFLPFTTLLYVFMWTPGVGLVGWEWMWIGLAAVMDITSYYGHYRTNRERMPGYTASQPV